MPNAPITIGTIVTFMFHSFSNSLARSRYLSFFSLSFRFILWSAGTAKSTILQILFLLLIIIRSGLLAGIRWSVCMFKSHRSLCESFSWIGAGLYIYHLFVWSTLLSGFHTSVNWWFITGVWVIEGLYKSPGLSILADLNKAVVWMVFTRPLISTSSSPSTNFMVTVLSTLITIGITVTFIFHCFFSSQARSRYISLFFSFFYTVVSRKGRVYYSAGSLFVDYYYYYYY